MEIDIFQILALAEQLRGASQLVMMNSLGGTRKSILQWLSDPLGRRGE
jgi:hypothetical protein